MNFLCDSLSFCLFVFPGHVWVKALVKKYRKHSLVSLVLGGAVGLSATVLIITEIYELTQSMSFLAKELMSH